jgi:hypothetical protein
MILSPAMVMGSKHVRGEAVKAVSFSGRSNSIRADPKRGSAIWRE